MPLPNDVAQPPPPEPVNPFEKYVPTVDPAGPPPAQFDQYVDRQTDRDLQPLAGSMYAASKLDPDRHAQVLEYADKTGQNADLVSRNLEYFRGLTKYDDAQQGADMAAVLHQSPKLALWLQNRDNAAIAQDDLPTLRRLHDALTLVNPPEKDSPEHLPWLQAIGATLRKSVGRFSQGVMAIPAVLQRDFRDMAGIADDPSAYSPLGYIYSAEDSIRDEERAWSTYQESTAQKLTLPIVGMLGSPGNILPLAAGARAAKSVLAISEIVKDAAALKVAAGAMGAQTTAGSLGESLRARQESGEAAGQTLVPTMGEITHAGLQGALAYVMGTAGGLTGTLRSLRNVTPSFGESFGDVGRQAVVGGTQGALGQDISGLFNGRLPTAGEQAMAYLSGSLSAGALAGLNVPSAFAHVAGARMMDRALEAHTAADGAANLARAAVALTHSKTQERSTERMQDLMAAITAASGQESSGKVYAQGDVWDAYWHEAGMDPEQVATAMTGDSKAYAQAVATGGQIEIPQATFLSKLAGTEHFAKLLNKVSLGPDKPTLEQANETFKTFSADLQKLHESIRTEIDTGAGIADPTGEAVYQDIYQQRLKSGAAPDVAKVDATLWQHAMVGIARQYSETAKESGGKPVTASDLFQSMRLQIHREIPDVLRGTNASESIEPILNQLRQARAVQENVTDKKRGAVHLPEHLRQMDEALRQAGIDIAEHPTNETIFQTVRDRMEEQATAIVGEPRTEGDLENNTAPVTFEQRVPVAEGQKLTDIEALRARAEAEARGELNQQVDVEAPTGKYPAIQDITFEQGQRGTITFGDLGTTIRLFQSENLSTFSHESAHAWLGAFGTLADREDAPTAMKEEWSKILAWMEVGSSAEIGTKQHEQWAEAWEHYLREGKAPSADLRPAFSRIKAWMLQVYADIKAIYRSTGGKPKLTDEMRGIFDRMLASKEEIAAANERDSADPLFMTAAQAGMSEAAFASYQKRALAEREQRQDLLERKLVGAFLKEHTKLYQEERAKVRGEVATELNGRRDLAAVALLQRGKLPDGTAIEGPEIKLDRTELAKVFGEENLSHLPGAGGKRANQNNRGPMVYAKEGGIPIDVVAEMLGYQSGSELFHELMNAPDIAKTIDGATDQRMAERYPDPLTDGSVAQKVIEATHEKERRAEILDEESQALAAKVRASATPRQVIKTMARETIDRMAPKDISPNVYRVAEAKAGREAFEAVSKGDFEKALVAKQRQQINHELCRAAIDAKAEATKIRDHLSDLTKAPARERIGKAGGWEWTVTRPDGQVMKLPTEESARSMAEQTKGATWQRTSGYLESIDRILASVSLDRMSAQNLRQEDLPLFKALAEFQQEKNAQGIPVDISREVMARGPKNWQQLSIEELRGIGDAVRNIEHAARSLTKTLQEQRAKDFIDLQAKVGAAIVANSKGPRAQRLGSNLFSPLTDQIGKFLDYNTRVTDLIYRMNGHAEGGDIFWNWQHPLNQAGDREGEMLAAATVEQQRLLTEWGKTGPFKSIGLNRPEYIPEIKQSLNKLSQIIFACHYGNLGNRDRLLEGMKIDDGQAQAVLDKLDKGDWAFVNGLVKHVNSFKSEIFALEERVHGVAPESVESAPFMTKYGEQPGGYFPVKYDNRLTPAPAHETPEAEAEGMLAGRGPGYAMTAHGHTEARKSSQGRPLDLDFGVIAGHLNRVIKDLAQRETLMSLNRLLRSQGFLDPLVEHWGKPAWELFEQQLRSVARGPVLSETGLEKTLGFFRQGANAARRSLGIAYAIKQLPGTMAAIPRLGAENVLRAFVPAFSPEAHRWADAHSTSLRLRGQMRNKSLTEPVKRTSVTAALSPLADLAYLFAGKAWKVVDTHAWWAGFYKAQKLPGVNGDVAKAVAIADQIMNDTQGGFLPKDLPQVLRGGELSKVFTNNMSWANANFMLMANSLHRFADKHYTPKAAIQMASDMAMYLVVAPAIYLAASDALDGQVDDWSDPDKVKRKLTHESIYTALGSLPLLREASNAISEGRRAELPQGASGLGEVINLAASISKDITSDDEGRGVGSGTKRGLLKVAGVITHFPAWQVLRMYDGWTYAEQYGKNPILPTILGQRAPK